MMSRTPRGHPPVAERPEPGPRVLVCTPSHAVFGGAESILAALGRHIPRFGFAPLFALARGRRFHLPARYRAAYPELHAVELDGRNGTRTSRMRAVRRTLEEQRPGIVIVSRLFDALHAACEQKATGASFRLVTTAFANEPEYVYDLARYGGSVDLVVTDGRLTAEAVRSLTVMPADRVRTIPGPIEPPSVPRGTPRTSAPIRLGYAGRLEEPQKRVLDLVETLQRLRAASVPFTCRVAGAGPAEDDLRNALVRSHLHDDVRLEGWLAREALYARFYPELDVLLHFAGWEGNPIAPREALVHGVVPVMSRFLGIAADGLFRHEKTALLFDVGDGAEAARHVERLSRQRDLLQSLSNNAAAERAACPPPETVATQWAEALQAVLEAPVRRAPIPPLAAAGRLDEWPLPRTVVESLRRLRRRPLASEPGGEWPHWSGAGSVGELRDLRERIVSLDRPSVGAAGTADERVY